MRILLTGASGLIGSAVYASLKTHECFRLGRDLSKADCLCDLSDLANCQIFPACDALVHCAGVVDEDFADGAISNLTKILAGAEGLAQRAKKAGAKIAIYVSSSHVYGKQEGTIDESRPPNPLSYYAIAHFCTEQIFRKVFSDEDCQVVVLRPNAVYGALPDFRRFRRWSLIPFSFPLEAYMRGQITLRSSGEQRRNFVSSRSIAETICRILDTPSKMPAIINVLGNITESVYQYAERSADSLFRISGRHCAVVRPSVDSPTNKPKPLCYASKFSQVQETISPDEHLDQLMLQFTQDSGWLMERHKENF
ncbi:NAD-dependent epimerase/dehydratase family protein [Paraburkholderia adhaesiva]|uniref:NAD-dependent epimerase/dehydratase family protein n=1 Tax=Paraburkholderia adhaesiva TaxID=2883244 RepID=UPI001F46E9E4|nr:NAD-dependent epimerase/dehydratase family protein [Paraburkholderia adhaesiva]